MTTEVRTPRAGLSDPTWNRETALTRPIRATGCCASGWDETDPDSGESGGTDTHRPHGGCDCHRRCSPRAPESQSPAHREGPQKPDPRFHYTRPALEGHPGGALAVLTPRPRPASPTPTEGWPHTYGQMAPGLAPHPLPAGPTPTDGQLAPCLWTAGPTPTDGHAGSPQGPGRKRGAGRQAVRPARAARGRAPRERGGPEQVRPRGMSPGSSRH